MHLLDTCRSPHVCLGILEIADNLHKISRLIIYRWTRTYPFDVGIGFEPDEAGFRLVSTDEFVGYSHEKITKDIYEKI